MSPSLFILAISVYLISTVAGLIAAFFVKQISVKFINALIVFHFLIFMVWLLMRNDTDAVSNPGTSNYLFLTFFCSGVFTAGMLLRSQYPLYLKIYYGAYLLTLVIFVVSPSRVLGFIASGDVQSINPIRYHIIENYYFVEQQAAHDTLPGSKNDKFYKLVREMGMFHKTLSRDILLPVGTDSVRLTDGIISDLFPVRVYYLKNGKCDSLDLEIKVGNNRDNSKELKQIRN